MMFRWDAQVVGRLGPDAIVSLPGGLVSIADAAGRLPTGARGSVLAYEGDDAPAMSVDLGRFAVETSGRVARLSRDDRSLVLVLQPGEVLPRSLRLWATSSRAATPDPDPKAFGLLPRVSPLEAFLAYTAGIPAP